MNIARFHWTRLVKEVRKIAVERDTTLTGLVREYLENWQQRALWLEEGVVTWKPWSEPSGSFTARWGKRRGRGRICMNAVEFLDANVLVYAYDTGEPKKRSIAQGYMQRALWDNTSYLCRFWRN